MNSNDPNTPVFKLEIAAMVKVEVDVNPSTVNFRELLPGEKKSETVEVTNLSKDLLTISAITSPHSFINVNLADLKLPVSLKYNEKISFKVGVDADIMKDKTWGQVVIKTSNVHTPEVTLNLMGRVRSKDQNLTGALPQINYSDRAKKLFPLYNFVAGNTTQNLTGCNTGQCIPMKALIQLLTAQNLPDEKITDTIRQIYGPRAVAASAGNTPPPRPSLKESIQGAMKNDNKTKLELFVMSYCPFGLRAEKALDKLMAEFGSKLDLQLYFIAQSKTGGDSDKLADSFTSLHGLPEVEEDFRQVLIQKHFPEKLLPYLRLRNENIKTTDWKECAAKAGIDSKKLEELITAKDSQQLFRENLVKAQTMNIHASPTLFIDNVRYQGGFQ